MLWLVLTYGVPASLLLRREQDSILRDVDGGWLLWVVATQSLSAAASTLVPVWPSQSGLLASTAAGLWGVGLVLYILLTSLILVRWLTVPVTPGTLSPPYSERPAFDLNYAHIRARRERKPATSAPAAPRTG